MIHVTMKKIWGNLSFFYNQNTRSSKSFWPELKKKIGAHIMECIAHTFKAWRMLLHCPISAKISATVANQMRVFF